MIRGAVWTAAGGPGYAGKPRPVVIIQDDRFDATDSITVVPLTTTAIDAPLFRIPVEPTDQNGLHQPSHLMADKITTVSKRRFGQRLGQLGADDITRLNRAIVVFLGVAS